jgi:hypothetical protein
MKTFPAAVFLVVATALLTFSTLAFAMAPPTSMDSRDVLVGGIMLAGLVFAGLALRRFRAIDRQLTRV